MCTFATEITNLIFAYETEVYLASTFKIEKAF
jgi:hypothetical protein